MAGNQTGGKAAAQTNRIRYGPDFYARIGAQGGRQGTTGGFASEHVGADGLTGKERAAKVGVIGGRKSRRGKGKRVEAFKADYQQM